MGKTRIFTVGFEFPGDDFEYVDYDSDRTLLDADIILFQPSLGGAQAYESHNGKSLLSEHWSFESKRALEHWRGEIRAALAAGKLVIVYLAKPRECYRYTGEKQYSGTGKSRAATRIVTEISSYEAVPFVTHAASRSGSATKLTEDAKFLGPYWSQFGSMSSYEITIEGEFHKRLLITASGDRIVGAAVNSGTGGVLLLLPPIGYDEEKFEKYDARSKKTFWTTEAQKFGKQLVAALVAMLNGFRSQRSQTPPPEWTAETTYQLPEEARLEMEVAELTASISDLQVRRSGVEDRLSKAGSLRALLFEQGRPLEDAILEALSYLGFTVARFNDGRSEFDAVFSSEEGRFLGEAEGKDSKAINIDKFSQLERNLQEDFARDEVTDYAKPVLFGNAHRLLPPSQRGDFFTAKCISAAERVGAALVRTPDLFTAARYMKEHSDDSEFAKECRTRMLEAKGKIVVFPEPPSS